MRDRARLLLPPLLLLLLSCCALPTRVKELATPEILLDTVHNLKVFKPRAKHCIKNVISYRDAPPDRRGRFHVLLGRMVEYVDQITEKNYKAKIRQLARSGGTLNKAFGQAFSKCLQDPCSQPPEPGWCLQNMVMFYYDVDSRSCHEFTYTGCGRNFNNFLTKEECQSICTRVAAGWRQLSAGVWQCSRCPYTAPDRYRVRRHQVTHTGERRYHCPVCQARFTAKQSVITHLRRHTGERPYACRGCPARFARPQALASHARACCCSGSGEAALG